MTTKTKALLWEELRVAGSITALTLVIGWFVQIVQAVSVYLTMHAVQTRTAWQFMGDGVLEITLLILVATPLLLTLNIANSGHLSGGFSRRILRLPVDTLPAVTAILCARFVLVVLQSCLLIGSCWLIFRHGPAPNVILMIAGIYLLFQLVDWLRAVVPSLAGLLLFGAGAAWLLKAGGIGPATSMLNEGVDSTMVLMAGLVVFAGITYALSYPLVKLTRQGDRFTLRDTFVFEIPRPAWFTRENKAFSSPFTAQVWFEMRRTGLFMPMMTAVFWLIGVAVVWMSNYSQWRAHPNNGKVFHALSWEAFDPVWLFMILPYLAVILGAVAWSIRQQSGWSQKSRSGLRTFLLRQAAPKSLFVQARLVNTAINLGFMLAIAGSLHIGYLLFGDNNNIGALIQDTLSNGLVSYREVISYLLGSVLLVGFIAWCVMSGTIQSLAFLALLLMMGGLAVVSPFTMSYWMGCGSIDISAIGMWCLFSVPLIMMILSLYRAWSTRLISKKSLMACLVAWLGIMLYLMPFSRVFHPAAHLNGYGLIFEGRFTRYLFICLGISALAVLPYVISVLELGRQNLRHKPISESAEQHARLRKTPWNASAITVTMLCMAGLAFLIWLQLPLSPAYAKVWKANGLPVNLTELNDWYPAVPDEKNLAKHYLPVFPQSRAKTMRWYTDMLNKDKLSGNLSNLDDLNTCVIADGQSDLENFELIPEKTWRYSHQYWEEVGKGFAAHLIGIAEQGLTESRYPVDLRRGFWFDSDHLGQLRSFANILYLDAFITAVERHPDDAIRALKSIKSIAQSLEKEPLYFSQSIRGRITHIMLNGAQQLMSRMPLEDKYFVQLQKEIDSLLPKDPNTALCARGMIGECTITMAFSDVAYSLIWQDNARYSVSSMFANDVITPIVDLYQPNKPSKWIVLQQINRLGYSLPSPFEIDQLEREGKRKFNDSIMTRMYYWIPGAQIYNAEWYLRLKIDLTRTALAIERYRLANGRLPEALSDLVPAYLEAVPQDPWVKRGVPLQYRIDPGGGYRIYSVSEDRKNKGDLNVAKQTNEYRIYSYSTLVMPPLAFREGSQIAPPNKLPEPATTL